MPTTSVMASKACTHTLENPIRAWNTFGRLVWRLFRVMARLMRMESRYLASTSSTLFFKASSFTSLLDDDRWFTWGSWIWLWNVSSLCFSNVPRAFNSFSNLLWSRSDLFRRRCSSECCTSIGRMANKKLLIASAATCWDQKMRDWHADFCLIHRFYKLCNLPWTIAYCIPISHVQRTFPHVSFTYKSRFWLRVFVLWFSSSFSIYPEKANYLSCWACTHLQKFALMSFKEGS